MEVYNKNAINRLIAYIERLNGIGDKEKLSSMVKKEFNLTQDRKVFYSPDFSIRFSKSKSKRMSNTVLSLSALQKYDAEPFIVCIVTPETNHLLLSNSTFLYVTTSPSLSSTTTGMLLFPFITLNTRFKSVFSSASFNARIASAHTSTFFISAF